MRKSSQEKHRLKRKAKRASLKRQKQQTGSSSVGQICPERFLLNAPKDFACEMLEIMDNALSLVEPIPVSLQDDLTLIAKKSGMSILRMPISVSEFMCGRRRWTVKESDLELYARFCRANARDDIAQALELCATWDAKRRCQIDCNVAASEIDLTLALIKIIDALDEGQSQKELKKFSTVVVEIANELSVPSKLLGCLKRVLTGPAPNPRDDGDDRLAELNGLLSSSRDFGSVSSWFYDFLRSYLLHPYWNNSSEPSVWAHFPMIISRVFEGDLGFIS